MKYVALTFKRCALWALVSAVMIVGRQEMKEQEVLHQISRTLKELSGHQAKQTRILEALNYNLVEIFKKPSDLKTPVPTVEFEDNVFPWLKANDMQIKGELKIGDRKIEQDETVWVWVGNSWERVEFPYD